VPAVNLAFFKQRRWQLALVLMVTFFVSFMDRINITLLVAAPYAFSLVGIALWSALGDRFNIRALLAGFGFGAAGIVIYIALNTDSLPVVILCMVAAVFLFSAFTASEFALVQRILPLDQFAPAIRFYNGMTALIGGGLGPALMSPLIGDGSGTWVITLIALLNAGLLLLFYRMIRY
jgi:hypothetical protein